MLSLPLLGDAPSGASACQGPPCPHRSTVQPGWGLNTHLSLMGQCTKRPEGLTRTAPSYPCHYWGCEQLSHLALGHPEVSLKRTHQAGALGPWQGPLLQARVPTQVREGENGHPVCWGEAGLSVRAGCQGPGVPWHAIARALPTLGRTSCQGSA